MVPKSNWLPLSRLPVLDASSGEITAVIETPKGSPNKFDYDEDVAGFRLSGVMPEGTTFPYNFGFVPSTVAEDGDPLDVLVFLDAPVVVGCVLTIRLIGVIEAEQRESDDQWVRNDRVLAVATHAHTHDHVHSLDDLRPGLVEEIEAFFGHYNEMRGKVFKPVGRGGREKARTLLDKAASAFEAEQREAE